MKIEIYENGLTSSQVLQERQRCGLNQIDSLQTRSLYKILLEVIREPMFLLLLCAGSIYFMMGDIHETLVLFAFIWIIVAITVFQEWRTENVLNALRDLSSPRAVVIRDGKQQRIPGQEVVCGDLLILHEGDRIPADGILLDSHEFSIDESMLTGESLNIARSKGESVFAGTLVVGGQGIMRVQAIGHKTELGKIGKSLQKVADELSPLQIETAVLTQKIAWIAIAVSLLTALFFFIIEKKILEAIIQGITLAMGILPQEFPVIMIVFMALGARRIAAHNVLTRRLNAIETLGATTILCVDKTGTLTQNKMKVQVLSVNAEIINLEENDEIPERFHQLIEYALLASEIDPHDPMEKALHELVEKYSFDSEHLHPEWNLTKEYELLPEFTAMSHLWTYPDYTFNTVSSKGSPEAVIDLCHMNEIDKNKILNDANQLAEQGMRVIAVAKAIHQGELFPESQHGFEFNFLGLVGLSDPIRANVPESVAECHSAGIRVVMITGDHPMTARAIAKKAGLKEGKILTGTDLENMSFEALKESVRTVSIFARVNPHHKLRIIDAYKANGEVVAMTGDGVNDAPALKSAHIGIAMGKRGTDVAREASSLVLLEDNFDAIVATIRLGRRIYDNLHRAMTYTVAVHIPIIGTVLLPILLGMPPILAPIHIVFMELMIDPACTVVFEAENEASDIMSRPPRKRSVRLIGQKELYLSLAQGLIAAFAVVMVYKFSLSLNHDLGTSRAMAFLLLVSMNTLLLLNYRREETFSFESLQSISKTGILVITLTMGTILIISTFPQIGQFFMFSKLSFQQIFFVLITAFGMFWIFNGLKNFFKQSMK